MFKTIKSKPSDLFHGSALKINRAQQHIRDIESKIESWRRLEKYRADVKTDTETGQKVLRILVTDKMPEGIALVIGDAVHNLRSALDLAAYEIILRSGASESTLSKSQFPFEGNRDALMNSGKLGLIKSASEKAANIIVNTIEPYKGGNDTLCALNNLSRIDKHSLLIPSVQAVSVVIDSVKNGKESFSTHRFRPKGRIHGTTIWLPSDIDIKSCREPVFDVFFSNGTPVGNQPVVETLIEISIEVRKAIGQLGHIED